jgi:hypothetical protein
MDLTESTNKPRVLGREHSSTENSTPANTSQAD